MRILDQKTKQKTKKTKKNITKDYKVKKKCTQKNLTYLHNLMQN